MVVDFEKLQSYFRENARAQAEAVAVPPFALFFHATDQSAPANFAIPDSPLSGDLRAPLHQVEAHFAARQRRARFHFLYDYAPELTQSLQACGYAEVETHPLMVCTPESLQTADAVAGLEFITITRDSPLEEVIEGWNTNALGFDPDGELVTVEQAEAFRQGLEGNLAFTAKLDGQAAGAGMFNPIRDGVTDLVGVTTLIPFRRRGIAAALSAFATQAAFNAGAEIVFLGPENDQAQRIYERIGYRLVTVHLAYQAKE
jgi:ribosomal protein S18 acetylase RimI-like enzyme